MKTLDEISLNFGTDKSSLHHKYTPTYSFYFESLRFNNLKILEIGVAEGDSLKMWKEYFVNANIVGVDIVDKKLLEEDRIKIFQGNQSDYDFLSRLNEDNGPFDIIIDDGSHINRDMKKSFEFLFPLLRPGGLYVVEDLHNCYTDGNKPVFINLLKNLVDRVMAAGKSICANIQYNESDKTFFICPKERDYRKTSISNLNWWEKSVEYVHLYRSLVFIKKYPYDIEKTAKDSLAPTYSEKIKEIKKFLKRQIPVFVKRAIKKLINKD